MAMDPPPTPAEGDGQEAPASRARSESTSQQSEDSQTAADFIRDQMQLEADAREALPYSIDDCTKHLGPLRQRIYACLTCNPPPAGPQDSYNPAGVCYSCSIQCHGEHELVEIFHKRSFTCDCGTSRIRSDQPCTLRVNTETNARGNVHSETPDPINKYNQNFRNRFCSCSIDYKAHEQRGTMYKCLGLGTHETGGCGEDWYHPTCLVGMGPEWYDSIATPTQDVTTGGTPPRCDDIPPPGFPGEDDFDHFICYKCVEAYPWIKRYAGTPGFLPPVFLEKEDDASPSKKRRLEDDVDDDKPGQSKRVKGESEGAGALGTGIQDGRNPTEAEDEEGKGARAPPSTCKMDQLPPAPVGRFSLLLTSDFRDHFCRCPRCFPSLDQHPQLLEEEEEYEPPLSDSASERGSTHGSGNSLLERGESALKNVDRVRAIEGVMAYNHLKEQLKPFFRQFAESGQAISADDIKDYFAKLRGDETAIREAGAAAAEDNRREQSGY